LRWSCGAVKGGVGDGLRQGFPAVDLSHDDLARCHQRPEQHWHGFGAWQDGLSLDAAAEFLVETLDCVCGPGRFPLAFWQAREGEELVSGLFQAVGDGFAFQPPFVARQWFACKP